MSAIGKVIELNAEPLFDLQHKHAGKVIVTIVCEEEHALAWGELWGRDVQALPFVPPAADPKR